MKSKSQSQRNTRRSPITSTRYFGATAIFGLMLCQFSAAATTWSGLGGDDNWSTTANWDNGTPGLADTAVFGEADAVATATTVNNIVDATTTVATLTYGNKIATNFQVTQIPAAITLAVAGAMTVGGSTSGAAVTKASLTGAGSLVVYGSPLNVGNSDATTAQQNTILDLAGLAAFSYENSAGTIAMGVGNRSGASIRLAAANTITAATLNLLTSSSSSSVSGTLSLGSGTNVINANTLNIGTQRGNATVSFADTTGGLKLRGSGGTDNDRSTIIAGWRNNSGGSGGTTSGTLALNKHAVDMKLNVLTLGQSSNTTATGTNNGNGVLSFNSGTIDVTTLRMGISSAATATANGTLTVGTGGTLLVGTGGISLANQTNGTAIATGTLNLSGGTAVCTGNIFKTTAAGTGSINLSNGGTLTLPAGTTAGAAAIPVNNLSTTAATINLAAAVGTTNITVNSLAINGPGSTINMTSVPLNTLASDVFTLVKYGSLAGLVSDLALGPLPTGITAHLVDNPTNSSIDLVIDTVVITNLTWTGAVDGDWDTGKLNWTDGGPAAFAQNHVVTFDDSATGATTVNLTTSLAPGRLTVNNTLPKNYTFTGIGNLAGITGLTKSGSGTLTIANSGTNTFSGEVNIAAGKIVLGEAADRLPVTATVVLADESGAALDLNSFDQRLAGLNGGGATGGTVLLGSGILTLTGTGSYAGVIDGTGALAKTGAGTQILAGANLFSGGTTITAGRLTLANPAGSGLGSGPVSISGTGVLAIGNGDASGSVAAATLTDDGSIVFNRNDTFAANYVIIGSGGITKQVAAGTLTMGVANTFAGPTAINAGAILVSHPDALGGTSGATTINNAESSRLELSGGVTLNEPFQIACKTSALTSDAPSLVNLAGNNTLAGPINLTSGGSYWTFSSDADKLTLGGTVTNTATSNTRSIRLLGIASGEISSNLANSAGNLSATAVIKDHSGTWTLSGTNTYTGNTTVNGGTLLVNGTTAASAVSVGLAGTLGGTGTVGTVTAAGTIAPGPGIGTLSAGPTTLTGILAIDLDATRSDHLNVTGTLALDAAMVVVSGTPVASSYTLATATAITGTPALQTPAPSSPLGIRPTTSGSAPPAAAVLTALPIPSMKPATLTPSWSPFRKTAPPPSLSGSGR